MIFVLWGEDKSCKDTLGLTFPKPLVVMEFDIGGFDRACRNLPHLPIKDWYKAGLIKLEQFVIPFQMGKLDPIENIIRATKIVVGMKELFYQFAGSFIRNLQDPNIQTIMVDTGTLLYDITCQGYLQELQEKQMPLKANTNIGADNKPLRVQLLPIEYREPYIRMRGFAYQANAFKKHLVVTHHASDEYGLVPGGGGALVEGRTGKRVMHGWSQWGDSADVMGRTWWDNSIIPESNPPQKVNKPKFIVELAEVKELEGMIFEEPTYDKINNVIRMIRGE